MFNITKRYSTIVLMLLLSFSWSILLVFSVNAQTETLGESVIWDQTYGGPKEDEARSLVQISDGGYIMAGYTLLPDANHRDFWLVKTDLNGNMEWNQTYQKEGDEYASSVVQTTDGGFALAGYSMSFAEQGNANFFLVKTDASGDMQWNQTYNGGENDYPNSLIQTSDGGYAIVGTTLYGSLVNPTVMHESIWFVKTDPSGNVQWNQTYDGGGNEAAHSLVQTSDGGYALAGYTTSFGAGSSDFWLLKTDEIGTIEWNQTYGGQNDDSVLSLVQSSDGGYVLAGFTESFGAGDYDFWLVKTDADGNMEWNQTYGGIEADYARSLVQTGETGYAMVGDTHSFGVGESDFWLVIVDSLGNIQGNQTYGGTGDDVAFSVVHTVDGEYALAGKTWSFGAGLVDMWLIKADEQIVIPEFPKWVILPIFLIITLFVVVIKRRGFV